MGLAILLGLIGGMVNVGAALVLVLVVNPSAKRYEDLLVTFDGDNPGLKKFFRHQQRVGAAVVIGTALQLVALVLTIV